MTEPGTGSDLAAIKTTAVKDGDDYVINGSKTFISNGQLCDLVLVAVKTDPDPANAHRGISLVAVGAGRPGFVKGEKLHRVGVAAVDAGEPGRYANEYQSFFCLFKITGRRLFRHGPGSGRL